MKQRAPRGFTLIEVLVVIAIIAVLAAAVAPTAFRAPERARIASTLADYQAVKTATLSYFADTAVWPPGVSASVGFVSTDGANGWNGPYLDRFPATAKWGAGVNNYQNDAVQDWTGDGAIGDTARYLEITLVPAASAATLDLRMDPAAGLNAGAVRYAAGDPTTVRILISTDVLVN